MIIVKKHKHNRDISIEFFRIMACFFVICIHISAGFEFNGVLSKKALFLGCIRADAVAMFWFITGAFLFRGNDYRKVVTNTIRRIVIPMLLLILCTSLLEGWLFGGQTITDSIRGVTAERIREMSITLFLNWQIPVGHLAQLWYLFTYIIVILLFPVLKAYIDTLNTRKNISLFLIGSMSFLVLNDISQNRFGEFVHRPFGAAFPAAVIMIWGYIIFKYKETLLEKYGRFWWIGGILFLAVNLCRCFIQALIYRYVETLTITILYWHSSFAVLTTVSLFFFICGLCRYIKWKWVRQSIIMVGSLTFGIYLLHMIIIDLLSVHGYIDRIKAWIQLDTSLPKQLVYYLITGMIVFALGCVCTLLIKTVGSGLTGLFRLVWSKCKERLIRHG